jgi:pentatricopeptide repeat protein
VALTAYERDSDWPRFLHTLQALARHLGGPDNEDEGEHRREEEVEEEEEDSRLARTCNRAVTCAVRERRWEAAVALHRGMQQAGLRVRPDLMAYNATMKGTSHRPPSFPPPCNRSTTRQ